MEKTIAATLAEHCALLRYEDLPPDTAADAKRFILDYLASAMAGCKINTAFNDMLCDVISETGGTPESTVLFYGLRLPARQAALLNSAIGHGADIDDGNRVAQGHPGVTVVPVALALAESLGLGGRDVIAAVVAGYDIFVRMGAALNPHHVSCGFHTTGTAGTLAAAAAAINLLKLTPAQAENALGFACMQAAGLLEIVESGQMSKGLNPAKACDSGILAAFMAKRGLKSPLNALEGKKGFLNAFADKSLRRDSLTQGLGREFSISTCYIKYYPACRHMHGAIDAGIAFCRSGRASLQKVRSVTVRTYQTALNITGNIRVPKSVDEAKFSLTYGLAVAMCRGGFTLAHLDAEKTIDSTILDTIGKIALEADPSMEDRAKGIRGARVEWLLEDGTSIEETVPLPKGDPGTPQTEDDMAAKVASCAEGLFGADTQKAVLELAQKLDSADTVEPLIRCLANRERQAGQ